MNISNIQGIDSRNSPITNLELKVVSDQLGGDLPTGYIDLLRISNGFDTIDGLLIYSSNEVFERNETFHVQINFPGYIAIGDDSGGSAVVIKLNVKSSPVYTVGHGAILKEDMECIADSIEAWVEDGCQTTVSNEEVDVDIVDIYLESVPENGMKDLLIIKKELGLIEGLSTLKDAMSNTPTCILKSVPYFKYKRRLERLKSKLDCLGMRDSRDPNNKID